MDVRAEIMTVKIKHPVFGTFALEQQRAHQSEDPEGSKWQVYAFKRGPIASTGFVFESLEQAQAALLAAFAVLEEAEPIRQEADRLAAEMANVHVIANDMLDPTKGTPMTEVA